MDHYRYSIIIPHYNIPELLERCLLSIPDREDIQTIVVDDCSPEECQDSLRSLAERFPHVTFLSTGKNGGAGRARNVGLERAEGYYLLFADADDYYTETFSAVLDDYRAIDCDVAYFRNISVSSEDPSRILTRTNWIDEIFRNYQGSRDNKEFRCLIHNPWAKLFRRGMVMENGFLFDETPFSNDIFFVVSCGCKAEIVLVDQRVIYSYTERAGSLTSSFLDKPGELNIRAEACFRSQKVIHEKGYHFHFMPMTMFLSAILHRDRKLYKEYMRRTPEIYDSKMDAIRQVRWWENGLFWKLKAYVYAF